jgi:hypothetical protein
LKNFQKVPKSLKTTKIVQNSDVFENPEGGQGKVPMGKLQRSPDYCYRFPMIKNEVYILITIVRINEKMMIIATIITNCQVFDFGQSFTKLITYSPSLIFFLSTFYLFCISHQNQLSLK